MRGEPQDEAAARRRLDGDASRLSTRVLIGRIAAEGKALIGKEIDLARAELRSDLRSELRVAKAVGAGALLAICAVNLILVAVAFALAAVLPGWAAALIVAGGVLIAAALAGGMGWARRVRSPLRRTRRHLREDVRWFKERLA